MMNESPAERVALLKQVRSPTSLLVNEVFTSLQGESSFVGQPCFFIRLAVCHLRCTYCDTARAFHSGTWVEMDELMQQALASPIKLMEITGGEPLLQRPVLQLLSRLCDAGKTVLLETSGAVKIDDVDRRVRVILDVKTPGSGESARNVWKNLDVIWPACEVKFVICDRQDYEYAKRIIQEYGLLSRCRVLVSPEHGRLNPAELAGWVVEDALAVQFQMQLHKILWGDMPGV